LTFFFITFFIPFAKRASQKGPFLCLSKKRSGPGQFHKFRLWEENNVVFFPKPKVIPKTKFLGKERDYLIFEKGLNVIFWKGPPLFLEQNALQLKDKKKQYNEIFRKVYVNTRKKK